MAVLSDMLMGHYLNSHLFTELHLDGIFKYGDDNTLPTEVRDFEGILPKGPYLPCVSMAGRAILAGYHRLRVYDNEMSWGWVGLEERRAEHNEYEGTIPINSLSPGRIGPNFESVFF